jgi:hypothetical protein
MYPPEAGLLWGESIPTELKKRNLHPLAIDVNIEIVASDPSSSRFTFKNLVRRKASDLSCVRFQVKESFLDMAGLNFTSYGDIKLTEIAGTASCLA